jgi:site-specific recombinase XerD
MQSKGSTKTLDSAVRDFILDRQIGGCTTASIEAYQSQLKPLIKWATNRGLMLPSLTEEHLRQFLLFRGEAGKATLHSATVRLKTFFKWCAEREICNNLAASIRKPRQAHPVISTLSVNELQAMLSLCRGNGFVSRRDEALTRFLVDTAARVSEALDLTIERLEVDSGKALLNGKGDRQRYVFFGPKTARALTRYLAVCDMQRFRSNAVFVNRDGTPMNRRHAHQTIVRLGRRANVREKRCSPHTLRHTSALFFLRRGGDALSLQRLLGHTTLAMTNRYVSSVTVDDLEAAHRRASPGDAV